MGAAVIAVVFIAGLIGVPTLFGHGASHAQPPASTQQAASAQTTPQAGDTATRANVDTAAVDTATVDTPTTVDADANRP